MDALDTHSVYTDEINKVASNTMDSRHYDTSKPCSMCGYAVHTFDDCELLKTWLLGNTIYPLLTMKEAVEPTTNGLEYIINIPDYYCKWDWCI